MDESPGAQLDDLPQFRTVSYESTDPLRPMRLFGITDGTAIRYVATASGEDGPISALTEAVWQSWSALDVIE